jgi:hypothetical protein
MLTVAEPYARFTPTLNASSLVSRAVTLVPFVEQIAQPFYLEKWNAEVEIVVRLEQGTTKTWIKIGVGLAALNTMIDGVGKYGDLREGLNHLIQDGRYVGQHILSRLPSELGFTEPPTSVKMNLGDIGRLKLLFDKVERGELSAHEATKRAVELLEKKGLLSPTFNERLLRELSRRLPRLVDGKGELPVSDEPISPVRRRPPSPLPPEGFPEPKFRVIANRDPKTGKVKVKPY